MTKEQMLEQWTRIYEQGYYKCAFTPKVYEYLDEKTDQIPETVMSGPKIYVDYDAWIIHELNGDNAELARRMLVILSKIRRDGPIHKWGMKDDLEICLLIGYGHDFRNLIKESVQITGSPQERASIKTVPVASLRAGCTIRSAAR